MRIIFELLSMADFFTPLDAIRETVQHDATALQNKSWTFFANYDECLKSGWNEKSIRKFLKGKGIETWGSQIVASNGILQFDVSLGDSSDAEQWLLASGVPLDERYVGAPKVIPPDPTPRQVYGVAKELIKSRGRRTWTWIPCLMGEKSCKGKMTCSNCNCCESHCSCLGSVE